MTVRDVLGSVGAWSLSLVDNTPDEVLSALDFFGHVAIVNGPVDVLAVGDNLLPSARYVGILRQRTTSPSPALSGVGMIAWLGDEDNKGEVFESPIVLTNVSFSTAITAVLPASVQVGTIFPVSGSYTGTFQFQTPREALDIITAAFGAEWFVNGAGRVFAGLTSQLYSSTPKTVVVRRNAGTDLDLTALGASFDADTDVVDYTTRVLLLGKTDAAGTFATGSADAPSVPYRNLFGGTVKRTRTISESGTTEGTVAQRAGLALNRFSRQRKSLKVTAEKYETDGTFRVGDYAYVYDPESGVFDAARQITFRGEVLHPDVIRVTTISYPVSEGHTVGFRRGDGTWLDLTRYVVWENGSNEVTVGDLPKSLGGASSNVAVDRLDAASVDLIAPKAPTALQVSSDVIDTGSNGLVGQAYLSWAAPTQNADNTSLLDFAGFVAQYKLSSAPVWTSAPVVGGTAATVTVIPGRNYDFRVIAQDKNGNDSVPSATVSTLTVLDTVPPLAPSDPAVTSYLGQLRVAWNGKMADGSNPPGDFFQVDVHVGTTSGFAPTTATLVSSLLEAGVAYATAPYGSPRFVKLIALDRSQNASAPSGVGTGSTVQAGDGDVSALNVGKLVTGTMTAEVAVAGRITTALTGARVEMNSTGIYKVNADGTFAVAIDGTRALLTGTFMTAASGRRITIGALGEYGKMDFIAPDGRFGRIITYTEPGGLEAMRIEAPRVYSDAAPVGSYMNLNSSNYTQHRARIHEFASVDNSPLAEQRLAYYTTAGQRFLLDNTGMILWGAKNTARIQINDSFNYYHQDAAGYGFFCGNDGVFNIRLGARGRYEFKDNGSGADQSGVFSMFSANNFGGGIRFVGNSSQQNIDVVNTESTVWYTIRASQFLAQSDERSKTEPLAVSRSDMLEEVLGLRVRRYHRKNLTDLDGNTVVNPREEVGFISQEVSDRINYSADDLETSFVDQYQTLALTVGALQALHRDFTEYRESHA